MDANEEQKAHRNPGTGSDPNGSADTPGGSVETLVARAQGGDAEAFEDLYRRYVSRVYAVCLRLTADTGDAERLTQDAFVQAWRKLGTYRAEAAFSTWLHRLAVNTVWQDRRASRRRRTRIITTDAAAILDGRVEPPPSGAAIDLERAVAALPERARMVFVLHDVEGYRHEEIAEMMNTSVGTSKAQLHRARALLRKAIGR